MGVNSNPISILAEKPERKLLPGRVIHRWDNNNNIKIVLGIYLVQDGGRCWAPRNTAINFRFQENIGKFLNNSETAGFFSRTRFPGVNWLMHICGFIYIFTIKSLSF
jgi:hypothetical protein